MVQLAPEEPEGAILLASFQRNVRDFIYPYPQLLPSYGCADREVLMEKCWDFPVSYVLPPFIFFFCTRTSVRGMQVPGRYPHWCQGHAGTRQVPPLVSGACRYPQVPPPQQCQRHVGTRQVPPTGVRGMQVPDRYPHQCQWFAKIHLVI